MLSEAKAGKGHRERVRTLPEESPKGCLLLAIVSSLSNFPKWKFACDSKRKVDYYIIRIIINRMVGFHMIEIVDGEEGPKEMANFYGIRSRFRADGNSSYFLYIRLFFKLASASSKITSEVSK